MKTLNKRKRMKRKMEKLILMQIVGIENNEKFNW